MTAAFSAVVGDAYTEAVERRSTRTPARPRRVAVHTEHLSDDEAKQVRDAALRVENFTQFATPFFYLLSLGKKLERRT
jgi:hypothetical protein